MMSCFSILHRAFKWLEDYTSNELLKKAHVKRSPLLLQDVPVTQRKGKWLISLSEQWLINICRLLFLRVNPLIDVQIFLSILFYSKTVITLVYFSPSIGNFFHCPLRLLPWEGVAAETPFHKDCGSLKPVCLEPVALWDPSAPKCKAFYRQFFLEAYRVWDFWERQIWSDGELLYNCSLVPFPMMSLFGRRFPLHYTLLHAARLSNPACCWFCQFGQIYL